MSGVVIAETVRRIVTSVGFLIFAALTMVIASAAAHLDRPGSLWPGMIGILTLIVGCQNIGPEFSSGTLQLILAKPIGRSTYLLSRVAGAVLVTVMATAGAFAVELIGRAIRGTDSGAIKALGANASNAAIHAVLVCSLLALIGTFARSYANIALYLVLQIGLDVTGAMINMLVRMPRRGGFLAALGEFFENNTWIARSFAKVNENLFPEEPQGVFDGDWTMLVLTNSAVALLVACFMFRRKEVPYGAD